MLSPVPTFTLMARLAALCLCFSPFFSPHITLLYIKVIKFILLAPAGVCQEVYPFFTSVEVWDIVCEFVHPPRALQQCCPSIATFSSFFLSHVCSFVPPTLSTALALPADAVMYAAGSRLLHIALPRPLLCKYFGLWAESMKARGEQMRRS